MRRGKEEEDQRGKKVGEGWEGIWEDFKEKEEGSGRGMSEFKEGLGMRGGGRVGMEKVEGEEKEK